ncbi:hypothetical protein HNR60_000350 [Rhodopseudomonas rhenobacensis]|uniref:Uncharacterized protein n=1 Tax=Rhodopseudomonas rhenobacensis TaxID=87461 RepID=A0A7W8DY86_9BRAD|nr:hypothetical protein [Rhodopseudomonas rhenobacensis]MBB5045621.1 hypothetical protein [Rhodopseudomonas rhenobacensis]
MPKAADECNSEATQSAPQFGGIDQLRRNCRRRRLFTAAPRPGRGNLRRNGGIWNPMLRQAIEIVRSSAT